MIPRLEPGEPIEDVYLGFLAALEQSGWRGEISADYARRLLAATDNSVYQVLPQAVLYPRDAADVEVVMGLLGDDRYRAVRLAPRGGGTGTNGQSLTDGLVLDVSRHLNRILEVDLVAGLARVQPGVVLDQLNDHLAPHGVFFAPSLSPSSRATIGGMISTDAAGKGSRVYGKTSEHVVELQTVLLGGDRFESAPIEAEALAELTARGDRVGAIHRTLDDIQRNRGALIEEVFPKLRRFMTGYNLAGIRDREGRFDLNAVLCGSEGTLGVLVEAVVRLTPIPTHSRLAVLSYGRFDHALASAEELVLRAPSAIETIDDMVLGLARQDAIWHRVGDLLTSATNGRSIGAINLVEFSGTEPEEVERKLAALVAAVEEVDPAQRAPHAPLGLVVAADDEQANALWALRKKGVGLLGNAPGPRKPVAFVEDTVVPPENLKAYIAEFRALLDAEGLRYGMFGHIDVGCLHVRPALDLKDPEDVARMQRVSDAVCELVQRYGGVIWGEHGKGMRSAYSPRFFGPLYPELQRIKAAFDPHGQLNPGKLATPATAPEAKLVSIASPTRGAQDRQIDDADLAAFAAAVSCNGNGACFDYHPDHVMCPSSKVTRDRVHSPKGRAGVMREWLRQLAVSGHGPAITARRGSWLSRARNTWSRAPDYSHEVFDSMHGCLSCKACATQCPVKVDVPAFKAHFLDAYYGRYLRPVRDHLIAGLEHAAALGSLAPRLANWFTARAPVQALLGRFGGIVDPPALSESTTRIGLIDRGAPVARPSTLAALSEAERARAVVIVQDAFTRYFESDVALAVFDLLRALGFEPYVAPFSANGKGLHVKGFLGRFRRRAARNARRLEAIAATGVPLVGIDPAVVLTYRDEYPHALGVAPEELGFEVHLVQSWLVGHLDAVRRAAAASRAAPPFTLMAHCTERTAAPTAERDWQAVFEAAGLELEPAAVGCCGMCGVYGHEREHAAESRAIFDMSWAPRLGGAPPQQVLVDGFSCRSQIHRCQGWTARHPAQALIEVLRAG